MLLKCKHLKMRKRTRVEKELTVKNRRLPLQRQRDKSDFYSFSFVFVFHLSFELKSCLKIELISMKRGNRREDYSIIYLTIVLFYKLIILLIL